MEQNDNLGLIIVFGSIIWMIVLYVIISSAVKSKKKIDYLERQIRLLMLACKKLGATQEEVNAALNNAPVNKTNS